MTRAALVRHWFKPIRGVIVGCFLGTGIAHVANDGHGKAAALLMLLALAALLFLMGPTMVWTFHEASEKEVDAHASELCRCGHQRRRHGYPMIGEPPNCTECECRYLFIPIVLGPWDEKWKLLTLHHKQDVLCLWFVSFVAFIIVGVAYLWPA